VSDGKINPILMQAASAEDAATTRFNAALMEYRACCLEDDKHAADGVRERLHSLLDRWLDATSGTQAIARKERGL
jgi:hypothetical protein